MVVTEQYGAGTGGLEQRVHICHCQKLPSQEPPIPAIKPLELRPNPKRNRKEVYASCMALSWHAGTMMCRRNRPLAFLVGQASMHLMRQTSFSAQRASSGEARTLAHERVQLLTGRCRSDDQLCLGRCRHACAARPAPCTARGGCALPLPTPTGHCSMVASCRGVFVCNMTE